MAQDRYALLEQPREMWRGEGPKIQRVAHYLRNRKNIHKYYSPKLVSLGPIHHGEPHLELGEQYKLTWASMYVQGDRNKAQRLHQQVILNIKDLKDLYTEDAIQCFNDDELSWMLFLDGCALLQILKHPNILNPLPVLKAKVDLLNLVRQDALLLENQLSFRLLQFLSDLSHDNLIEDIDEFLLLPPYRKLPVHGAQEGGPHPQCVIDVDFPHPPNPVHLLDELRIKMMRGFSLTQPEPSMSIMTTNRNLKELRAAGIKVKRSKSRCPVDITFSSRSLGGELSIPKLVVDDTSTSMYLNLIAYEACPDFDNMYEISSFVEFLSSIIENPDDVKELRSCGCFINGLGSNEEVVRFFNFITADLVPNSTIYDSVRTEIERYYRSRYRTWLAEAYHAYFSNSGSFIAFLAASLALLLTFLQTWFTISSFIDHSN